MITGTFTAFKGVKFFYTPITAPIFLLFTIYSWAVLGLARGFFINGGYYGGYYCLDIGTFFTLFSCFC
jgi:hypothetical protein